MSAQSRFPPAFVVGCARSGTSILGELIGAHPQVRYVWEAHWLWRWVTKPRDGSHRLTADMVRPRDRWLLGAWFRWCARGGHLAVEKNPRSVLRIPFLRKVFPTARFIHIVRDGRDAACSLRAGIGGRDWKHVRPPRWRKYMHEHEGAVRSAYAWRDIVMTALADLQGISHLQVRYEDLVAAPRDQAERILEYLQLPPSPEVYEFCQKVQNETAGSYHAKNQTRWERNDHQKRVGRWRENLTSEERAEIQSIVEPLLAELGYEPES